ncbi:MAG: TetR/AcrR family transcriptional regulator [Beijerinckiaceae bacterium]|nr:TetR/AcrR family transcriptional regulator [Beijerinckiaceae bacterium]
MRPPSGRTDVIALLAEVFREQGFEGATLSAISKATGLGKGSLYHHFPGGKEEMAQAVLDEIDAWFEREVFGPLASLAPDAIDAMFDAVTDYFRSGRRVCLVGAFALSDGRARFGAKIHAYFHRWNEALAHALAARGYSPRKARVRAEEIVAGIQGGIVLARAINDPTSFDRMIARLRRRARRQTP